MTASALKLDHVVFPVFEVEASYRFYADVMLLPLVNAVEGDDWGGKPWLMMVFALADGRELVLVALRGAKRPSHDGLPRDARHLAFAVASAHEQDAWRRRLTEHRIDFWEEDHGRQKSIYFADPNGVVIEITTPASAEVTAQSPRASEIVRAFIAR
jgi:catechol 2,3-dioxygenase-like lactoylglutathione lyase family enzyme